MFLESSAIPAAAAKRNQRMRKLPVHTSGGFFVCPGNRISPERGVTILRNILDFFAKLKMSTVVIALLSVAVVGMGGYIAVSNSGANKAAQSAASAPLSLEEHQAEYVKPETPIDRSKNVTLPGWGGFTIPAYTNIITQGFEFHNPEQNYWYEDWISINGQQLEKLVVDSGDKTELDHYLKLAGIQASATSVEGVDEKCFTVGKNDAGSLTLEAIHGFEGEKTFTVKMADGQSVPVTVNCKDECYYITFGLYLSQGDELLYQSGLVAPGLYVQQMEMTRSLAPGVYDAYVVCQPYQSDKTTKTNSGVVKITLTVQ